MRVMVIVKASQDSEAGVLPSRELLTAMGNFNEELVKAGVMLAGEGIKPSSQGVRLRFSGGKTTLIDGPFTETKEVIGGWAISKTDSKAEAVRIATEFMELHQKYWPGFDGESEVRLVSYEHFADRDQLGSRGARADARRRLDPQVPSRAGARRRGDHSR